MQSANRVLGIDGGGTKTEWVLLEGHTVLEQGVLPASNLKLVSDPGLKAIFEAMPREATHVGAFLAGCATAEDRSRLRALVQQIWPHAHAEVGSDRDSAFATAFGAGDGIVVIAGTGAAVHGRKEGRIEKAGGWGQILGDRGGGYHIAVQGLRLVLSRYDLNQTITPLAHTILRTLGLNRLQDLGTWAMQADKMSVARLAPCIFEAATHGEPEMLDVVQDGATTLAEFTRAVAQRLDMEDAPVKLVGGLFTHHPDYVALYKFRLSILLPKARVELCAESGALGAAWLAAGGQTRLAGNVSAALPADRIGLAQATTEQANPRSAALERLGSLELVDLFVAEEDQVAAALAACKEDLVAAVDLVAGCLAKAGRLFYVGAGTSGRLGVLDASEIPPTFGTDPATVQGIIAGGAPALRLAVEGAEDQPGAGATAVLERGVRPGDVVCGITASGRTPFVFGALEHARELGARTVLLTCNPARARSDWDVEIDLPTGPELLTGSTRLKAGTATKVALNILSTCVMVRLGRVRGNTMIDLNISNDKLRDRAVRTLADQRGIGYEEAARELAGADWNLRACLESGDKKN